MNTEQAISVLRSIPTHDAMQAEAVEMAVAGMRLDSAVRDATPALWWHGNSEQVFPERACDECKPLYALDNLRAAVEAGK